MFFSMVRGQHFTCQLLNRCFIKLFLGANIKQNNLIALAFMKKLCRFSRTYQDRLYDMLQILGLIEEMPEKKSHKIKEEIRKVVRGIR